MNDARAREVLVQRFADARIPELGQFVGELARRQSVEDP